MSDSHDIQYKAENTNSILQFSDISGDIRIFVKKKNNLNLSLNNDSMSYENLAKFPNVINAISSIKADIAKYGAKNASIYKHLKVIENAIENLPSPSPDILIDSLLPQILDLISNTLDQDAKSLSLKILSFFSLSEKQEIYDQNIILQIIKIISKNQSNLASKQKNAAQNVMYSYAFLDNLLKSPQYQEQVFRIILENELLSHIKMNSLSNNESRIVLNFLYHYLKLASLHWEDLSQFSFLIPNLISFFDPCPQYINQYSQQISSFSTSKQVLKCLSLFLANPTTCVTCLENNVHLALNHHINIKDLGYYMKCINLIYANQPEVETFLQSEFVEKLIQFIKSTDAKGLHEIFTFIIFLLNHGFTEFSQDALFAAFYLNAKKQNFDYILECFNFISDMINTNYIRLSEEGEQNIFPFFFDLACQMPVEYVKNGLMALTTLLANPEKAALINFDDCIEFLEALLDTDECDQETAELASNLLQKISGTPE